MLGADTIVVLDDVVLGKPVDAAEATAMLRSLRGRSHTVLSALYAWNPATSHEASALNVTLVWMREYADAEIAAYIASGDPMDKAGAYAIQNLAFAPAERIDGCFSGVMGFPLADVTRVLERIGLPPPTAVPDGLPASRRLVLQEMRNCGIAGLIVVDPHFDRSAFAAIPHYSASTSRALHPLSTRMYHRRELLPNVQDCAAAAWGERLEQAEPVHRLDRRGPVRAGIKEAHRGRGGAQEGGYTFDIAYTSVLKRAIRTLWITMDQMDLMWIPVHRSWRLNERHYGALQGLNKSETAAKFGEQQVKIWRRPTTSPPPPLEKTIRAIPAWIPVTRT